APPWRTWPARSTRCPRSGRRGPGAGPRADGDAVRAGGAMSAGRARRRAAGRGRLREGPLAPWLFLAPGLALFVGFRLYPLLDGLRLSFTNARLGRAGYAFVGLANYRRLLDDTRFHTSLLNTGYYAVASTVPVLALPLALAV